MYLYLQLHLSIECQIENDTLSFWQRQRQTQTQARAQTQIRNTNTNIGDTLRPKSNSCAASACAASASAGGAANQFGQYSFGVRRSGNKLLEQLNPTVVPGQGCRQKKGLGRGRERGRGNGIHMPALCRINHKRIKMILKRYRCDAMVSQIVRASASA